MLVSAIHQQRRIEMDYLTSWIEIPVVDLKRAKTFYEGLLKVTLAEMPMGPLTYAFFPSKDRRNTGALVHSEFTKPTADGVRIYFTTGEPVATLLERAERLGGTTVMPARFVSDEGGFIGLFRDTEGNVLGAHQDAGPKA